MILDVTFCVTIRVCYLWKHRYFIQRLLPAAGNLQPNTALEQQTLWFQFWVVILNESFINAIGSVNSEEGFVEGVIEVKKQRAG